MERFKYFFAYILGVDRRNIDLIPNYRVAIVIAGIIIIGILLITAVVLAVLKHKSTKKFIACSLITISQYVILYILISIILGTERLNFGLDLTYRLAIVITGIILVSISFIATIILAVLKSKAFKAMLLCSIAAAIQIVITYILMVLIETMITPTRNVGTGFNVALIWVTLTFVGVVLIFGALVAYLKSDKFKTFAKTTMIMILVHGIIVIVGSIGHFSGFSGQQIGYQVVAWITLILVVLLAISIVIIQYQSGIKLRKNETLSIAFAGVAVAMSFALSYVRFFRLPVAGSITLARFVPLAVYAYIFGIKRGMIAGLIWGTLRLFVDPYIVHPIQFVLEYPISFMMAGLAGLARYLKVPKFLPKRLKKRITWNNRLHPSIALVIGLLIVTAVRYLIHVTSGVIWISNFNPDVAAGSMGGIITFSLSFNSMQLADGLISMIGVAILMMVPEMRKLVQRTEYKFLYKYAVAEGIVENDSVPEEKTAETTDENPHEELW